MAKSPSSSSYSSEGYSPLPHIQIQIPTVDTPPGTQPQLRPVTILGRGVLSSIPSCSSTFTGDDHKFKKPLLPPIKQRQKSLTDEDKRKRVYDDCRRVQMHVQEATRKSQEAATSSAERHEATQGVSQDCDPEPECDTQRANLNNEVIEVPNLLVYSNVIFRSVVSKDAYHSLSEESREHLKKFLPKYGNGDEEEALLNCAFTSDQQLTSGNPLDTVQQRLKLGWYNPERYCEFVQIRDSNKVMYDHYIRFYHMNLMQKLLMSRHLLLSQYDEANFRYYNQIGVQPRNPDAQRKKNHLILLKRKAAKRSRLMISDCRNKVGEQGLSSDEENEDVGQPISKSLLSNSCQRSTLFSTKTKDLDLHQPLQCDDLKTMLKKFKKLKRKDPHAPSMQLKGIVLDEVYDRAGVLAQSEKIKQTVAALEKARDVKEKPNQ